MRRILLLSLILIIPLCLYGWEKGMKIAVIDIENRLKNPELVDTVTLTEMIQNDLVEADYYTVVERVYMSKILEEQKLQLSGLTDNEATKLGNLAGAEKIVTGSLSQIGSTYILILKVIDTETGKIELVEQLKETSIDRVIDQTKVIVHSILVHSGAEDEGFSESTEEETHKMPSAGNNNTDTGFKTETDLQTGSDTEQAEDRNLNRQIPSEQKEESTETDAEALERIGESAREGLNFSIRFIKDHTDAEDYLADEETDRDQAQKKDSGLEVNGFFPFQFSMTEDIQIVPQDYMVTGVAVNLISGYNVKVYGFQTGFICKSFEMGGVQAGVFNTAFRNVYGVQAGMFNETLNMYGVQASLFNKTSNGYGVQIGLFNEAKKMRGVQIGLFNESVNLKGVQLGMINTIQDGPLNFMFGINIGI